MKRLCVFVLLAAGLAACGGKASSTTPTPAPTVPLADPTSESLGGIALGTDGATVERLLGAPTERGPVEEEGASGEMLSTWTWPAAGVSLDMAMTGDQAAVHSISITPPSKLTTSRGVGIGTSRAEVERIYAEHLGRGREPDEPDTTSPEQLIIGSIYGGTFFGFHDGKVDSIFVGAGAE
ncbi:MAG: hypothetical protein R3B06_00195 [Kofleriaceae bacterium]